MPKRIQNITDEADQRHVILFEESEIVLTLRFFAVAEFWAIDVEYKGRTVYGFKLSANVLHMRSQNFPFDFTVRDLAETGIDPFKIDDFASGRCELYLLTADDMEVIRDGAVPL